MHKSLFIILFFLVSASLNEKFHCPNEPQPDSYGAIICKHDDKNNITQIFKNLQAVKDGHDSNFSLSQGEFEALVYYLSNTSSLVANKEINKNLTNEVRTLRNL